MRKRVRLFTSVIVGIGLWILAMGMYLVGINIQSDIQRKSRLAATPTMAFPTMGQTKPILVFTNNLGNRKLWSFDYKTRISSLYSYESWMKIRPSWKSPSPTPEIVSVENKTIVMNKLGLENDDVYWPKINSDKEAVFYAYPNGSSWGIVPPKKDVYKINLETTEYRRLYSTRSEGECSDIFYWNVISQELYAASVYPISSESYLTNFCVIDDRSGRIKKKIGLPRASTKRYSGFYFDDVLNRVLVQYYNADERFSTVVNMTLGSVKKISITGVNSYTFERTLADGILIFKSTDNKSVIFYDIKDTRVVGKIEIPDDDREHLYFGSYSPSDKYVLISKTNLNKYYLVNLVTRELISTFDTNDLIPNYSGRVYFDGWIE